MTTRRPPRWIRTTTVLILPPVIGLLCGGPAAASLHAAEDGRRDALRAMARNLNLDPQQLLDPASWDRKQLEQAKKRLAGMPTDKKPLLPEWYQAELADIKRQQAVHTLGGFLKDAKDGLPADEKGLPDDVRSLLRTLKSKSTTGSVRRRSLPERFFPPRDAKSALGRARVDGDANPGASTLAERLDAAPRNRFTAPDQFFSGGGPPPGPAESAPTVDAQSAHPLIVARAQALGNDPIKIHNFVRNEIFTELYSGSKKGAVGTLREAAGNDFDQASLLIALLRAAGIPARYEIGVVTMTLRQAQQYTGTTDFWSVYGALVTAGIPTQFGDLGGSLGMGFAIEHAWVRAFVPTTAYRGVTRSGSAYDWVYLSPAFKATTESRPVDLRDAVAFDFDAFLAQPSAERPSEAFERLLRQHIKAAGIQCETLDSAQPNRSILRVEHGLLPSELPVTRLYSLFLAAEVPGPFRHGARFIVNNSQGVIQFIHQFDTPDLWGKNVTIVYEPATPADQETLDSYGGVDGTPAYLVKMIARLQVDGQTVASGVPETLGMPQSMVLGLTGSYGPQLLADREGNSVSVQHNLTVGGVYSFVLDPGLPPADLIAEKEKNLSSLEGDAVLAARLHATGLTYLRELGLARKRIAGLHWHRIVKDVEEVMVAIEPRVTSYGSTPMASARDFFMLDAAMLRSGQVAIQGDTDTRRLQVAKLVGFESSFLEHRLGEVFWGPRQFSAVKLVQVARQGGVQVLTFGESNVEEALETIQWPEEFEDKMRVAATQGLIVQAPAFGHTQAGLGTLYGYIATHPFFGSGEYIVGFEAGAANSITNGGVGDAGGDGGGGGGGPECSTCGGTDPNGSFTNLLSGNYVHQVTDLTLPARGIPLSLTRTYSAQLGWHHNYAQAITSNPDGSLTWTDETGVPRRFVAAGTGLWDPPVNHFQRIEFQSGGGYRMVFPDGLVRTFDGAGRLVADTDLNGNQVLLSYGPNGKVQHVVGTGGNTMIFNYDANNRMSGISDSAGRAVVLGYDAGGRLVSETDVLGQTRTYAYDLAGRMVDKTDKRGNHTTIGYDDRSRVVRIQDAEGGVWKYAYDAANARTVKTDRTGAVTLWELGPHGRPTRTVDPVGNETVMTYDVRGNKLTEQDARGHSAVMTYDANGNVLSRTDPAGALTTFTYGPFSRLMTTTDADNRVTVNAYDAAGNLLSTTDAENQVTMYTYDGDGLPLTITRPVLATTVMTYDAVGNVRTMTDPEGGLTTLGYDAAGHLTSMQDPNAQVRTMGVDAAGQMLEMTDPNTGTTQFTYDLDGNRLTVTDAEDNATSFGYDKLGRLVSTTDALGNVTRQEYDAEDRVVARIDARGFRTVMQYDGAGRLVLMRDPAGNGTHMRFCAELDQQPCEVIDALGNVTRVEEDNLGRPATQIDPLGNTTVTGFDLLGHRATTTDAAGKTTTFRYDAVGRLDQVQDALGGVTTYQYDERGNRTGVVDANGHATTFAYDRANRLTSEVTPINTVTTFGYDLTGNRTSKLDGKGQATGFEYDHSRRLTEVTYSGTTAPAAFTYDLRGNKLTEANGDSHRTMTYDDVGRLLTVFDQETGRTVTYTYDANGNRRSMTVAPDNETTRYEWDSRNLLSRMVDPEGGNYRFAYDDLGRRTRTVYANGMTLATTYDAASRVTSMIYRDRAGGVLEVFAYTYDSRGNRTAKIFADGTAELYRYDDLSRLVGVRYPSGRAVQYTYDRVGNRVEMLEGTLTGTDDGCDGDVDCDGVMDVVDNCPAVANPGQEDGDKPTTPQGMVGAWRLEDAPGTLTARDSTGFNNDGLRIATGTVEGRFGKGINLWSGGGPTLASYTVQGVKIPNSSSLASASSGQNGVTVTAWMRNETTLYSFAARAIAFKKDQFGLQSYRASPDMASFTWYEPSGFGFFGFPEVPVADEVWTHVAAVADRAAIRIYVNGELKIDHARESTALASSYPMFIGCLAATSGHSCESNFTGDLDEVGVWPRALTQEEIAQAMAGPLQVGDGRGDACDACPDSPDRTCQPRVCLDRDGDGYGVQGASACEGAAGGFDCNEGDASVHPGAGEICDSVDNDCDGRVDEGCLSGATRTLYEYNEFNQLLRAGPPRLCAGDADCDGVLDAADNCPVVVNPGQENSDNLVLPADLVAAYGFDEASGTNVSDLTGTHPGTMVAGATRVPGRSGQAVGFDSVDEWVSIPTLRVPDPPFSLETTIRKDASPFHLVAQFLGAPSWYIQPEGQVVAPGGNGGVVPVDAWTHLAFTTDGTTARFYIDGQQTASEPYTFYGHYADGVTLGGSPQTFYGLTGAMDDFAVWSSALSPAIIARHATQGVIEGLNDDPGDACDPCPANPDPSCVPTTCTDTDGDGYGPQGASACNAGEPARFDCNDNNVDVRPGVLDFCNGIDDDCDGQVDEECPSQQMFVYDGNGNQVSKTEAGGVGTTEYEWDGRDRLVKVTPAGGGAVGEYGYDTQNLRVSMREGANERRILLDGIEEHAEYSAVGAGERVARYDHDPTRVDALLAQVTGAGALEQKVHPWADALGSVYGMGDASGTAAGVVARYSYDVYGARSAGAELVGTPWGFTGRRHEGGLAYYRDRYLSPATGLFVAVDSMGDINGPNLYRYVLSNPTIFRDPTGQFLEFFDDLNFSYRWLFCWGDCIDKFRADALVDKALLAVPAFSAYPKSMIPPFDTRKVMDGSPLTTILSSLAHYTGIKAFRTIGRFASRFATPVTILEGFFDWGVILGCGVRCAEECQ